MATQTKSVSGQVTTYTITDEENNAMTVAVTNNPVTGFTTLFGGSAVHNDAVNMAAQLLLLVGNGLLP